MLFRRMALYIVVAAVTAGGCLLVSACGTDSGTKKYGTVENYENSLVKPSDIKLLADFQNQLLYSRGKRLYFDSLELGGSSHIKPGEGLAVYKGGINEITDPSFEGAGWKLGQGALIDGSGASSGRKSLRYSGDGSSRVVAELRQPVPVVSGDTRTLSFDHEVLGSATGGIRVSLKVFDADGALLGSQSSSLELATPGWQRTGGFIYELPSGTTAYTIEIFAEAFTGVCRLDAFLAEPKDFFSPYFDGDSDNCIWAVVATPLNFAAERTLADGRIWFKVFILGAVLLGVVLASAVSFIYYGYRRRHASYLVLPFLLGIPVIICVIISLGVVKVPHIWFRQASLQGSYLEPERAYFYRVTALDGEGRESPPSIETRAVAGWLSRKIVVSWDRDPQAVKYRVYRGTSSYGENEMFEVGMDQSTFLDLGESGIPAMPPLELAAEDEGVPHASRSLRPEPEARISNTHVGLDTTEDFWVTGEVEFDFSSNRPFRPASLFEIGNPESGTQFAVSARYFPKWGDEFPKILLIKRGKEMLSQDYQALPPIEPGSVIRYVAGQLYQGSAGLPAGVHLWYRIDNGEVKHIFVDNTEAMSDWPLIKISKRYYYDEFGNNSICRNFSIVQGRIEEGIVGFLMERGSVPDRLGKLSQTGSPQ
ncbi:MAG: hypothetical protein ACYDGS_02530 [Thermoleophilia bacterium]